jgi:hypothetical protein
LDAVITATTALQVHPSWLSEECSMVTLNFGEPEPNRISSFHVVGGSFARVFQDGS